MPNFNRNSGSSGMETPFEPLLLYLRSIGDRIRATLLAFTSAPSLSFVSHLRLLKTNEYLLTLSQPISTAEYSGSASSMLFSPRVSTRYVTSPCSSPKFTSAAQVTASAENMVISGKAIHLFKLKPLTHSQSADGKRKNRVVRAGDHTHAQTCQGIWGVR